MNNTILNFGSEVDSEKKTYTSSQQNDITGSGFEKTLFNKSISHLVHCPVIAKGHYKVPTSVVSIGIEAFANCKEIVSIQLPNGLKKIDSYAFMNCIKLQSINIPGTVNEINFGVFHHCENLEILYCESTTPKAIKLQADTFSCINYSKCILYVPSGTKSLYSQQKYWRDFVTILEFEQLN